MRDGIRADLPELIGRVESGEGADRDLDLDALVAFGWRDERSHGFMADPNGEHYWINNPDCWMGEPPFLTNNLDSVIFVMQQALPGFWWRGGTCYLSSEARVCPDHNCPEHGARLLAECPPSLDHWDEGIEVELRPGSQNALVRALLAACLRALQAKLPEHADANSKSPIQAREE